MLLLWLGRKDDVRFDCREGFLNGSDEAAEDGEECSVVAERTGGGETGGTGGIAIVTERRCPGGLGRGFSCCPVDSGRPWLTREAAAVEFGEASERNFGEGLTGTELDADEDDDDADDDEDGDDNGEEEEISFRSLCDCRWGCWG